MHGPKVRGGGKPLSSSSYYSMSPKGAKSGPRLDLKSKSAHGYLASLAPPSSGAQTPESNTGCRTGRARRFAGPSPASIAQRELNSAHPQPAGAFAGYGLRFTVYSLQLAVCGRGSPEESSIWRWRNITTNQIVRILCKLQSRMHNGWGFSFFLDVTPSTIPVRRRIAP